MRISCNGCRVLRKGCNQDCTIRPCLQWIKSADSQANATLFLAKFYGRAGLLNLIESGPDHLRPAIFRSLLYEACGRIVNPVDGSVGLMWSGNWAQCQAAVDAVLNGLPITHTPLPSASASHQIIPPHRTYDIRHVAKDPTTGGDSSESLATRVNADKGKTQTGRLKRHAESVNQLGECSHDTWQLPSSGATHGYGHFTLETVESRREAPLDQSSSNLGFDDQVDINEVGLELRLG
ncbi:PREDICTED: LOB domain-containing protein 42-like [Camelina sativa]|uniref:LOB domain-containing protein 42-like n=1 Tax=Camelina sativa TaxID=90675 RepID=A0ABM0Z8B8_CAMSA|nr:PREDICTED: LOB domain-containing protein 42-like [Camelina sativa]